MSNTLHINLGYSTHLRVTSFPLADANGNAVTYLDNAGNVQAHYEYNAFGNTVSQSGTMAADFPFRFSSKYLDGETGLYYYGHRYLSPALGRWLSRDPIGEDGGKNLYEFIFNSPVDNLDVNGLCNIRENPIGEWPVLGMDDSNSGGVFVPRILPTIVWKGSSCPSATKGPCFGEIYIKKISGLTPTQEIGYYGSVRNHERYHAGCLIGFDSNVAALVDSVDFECPCGDMSDCDSAQQDYINARLQLYRSKYQLCSSEFDCQENDKNNPGGKYCKLMESHKKQVEKKQQEVNAARIAMESACKDE